MDEMVRPLPDEAGLPSQIATAANGELGLSTGATPTRAADAYQKPQAHVKLNLTEQLADLRSSELSYKFTVDNSWDNAIDLLSTTPFIPRGGPAHRHY